MKLPKTIRAEISQKGINNMEFFFDQSIKTTLCEVLQNCRRSGATLVTVDVKADDNGKGSKISVTDNGSGIKNPQDLLTYLSSGWDAQTQNNETPAGVGFCSLMSHPAGVSVWSQNWGCHISKRAFLGLEEVEVNEISTTIPGTTIEFSREDSCEIVKSMLQYVSWYYPVDVIVNGKKQTRKDIFENADHVQEFEDFRIGVSLNKLYVPDLRVNFMGLLVEACVELPYSFCVVVVDVRNNRALDLVLPARDKIVRNHKWEALKEKIYLAFYQAVFNEGSHRMSYEHYTKARELGIDLPEALPELFRYTETDLLLYENMYNCGKIANCADCPEHNTALNNMPDEDVLAVNLANPDMAFIFKEDHKMEKYSWYPKNTAVEVRQVLEYKDGRKEVVIPSSSKILNDESPEKITLELDIVDSKGNLVNTIRQNTNLAFTSKYDGENGIKQCWVAVDNSKVFTDDLVGIFMPYDEFGEKKDELRLEIEQELIRRQAGESEASIFLIEKSLREWGVYQAVKDIGGFSCKINDAGDIEITRALA